MATYYVDGNSGNDSADGSSARPWKTIGKASDRVNAGDEVRIRTAVYNETVRFRTPNTTWRADTGHTPVIDGRYHEGLFNNGTLPHPDETTNFLPPGNVGAMVSLSEPGITIDGLTVQNVAGSAISVSESNCTVRNCRVDFAYNSGIKANTTGALIDHVVIENNVCTRISVRYYDPLRVAGGQESVSGVLKIGRTRDSIVRNNVLAYGHGEGINIGKASYRTLVEGNIVHTCNHVHIYINRSVDVTIRNNLVYHLYIPDFVGDNDKPPAGIAIGDEGAENGSWPHSSGGQIYNNIVVGLGTLFSLRNNANYYDTQMENCYVGFNTFVGREKTWTAVAMAGNMKGRNHRNSVFENNIIYSTGRISTATGDLSGIAFRNNIWSAQPDAAMRGPDDRIGDPNLANAMARLVEDFPKPDSNIDVHNYSLTQRSTLAIGRASDGSRINNLQPPDVPKDFFGNNRGSSRDIGAHEFDGVGSAITANFSIGAGQQLGRVPHTVDFIDRSTADRPIVARLWDFGDGQTSTETSPSHTYETEGAFTVALTVTDDQGQSDTETRENFITTEIEETVLLPDTFRRFMVITQGATPEAAAYGTQFPDMSCVVLWKESPAHILNFVSIEDAQRVVSRLGEMDLVWVDELGDLDALLLGDEDLAEAWLMEATAR